MFSIYFAVMLGLRSLIGPELVMNKSGSLVSPEAGYKTKNFRHITEKGM